MTTPRKQQISLADTAYYHCVARCIRHALLSCLNISAENWLIITTEFRTQFHGAIDHEDALSDNCKHQSVFYQSSALFNIHITHDLI